MKAHNLETVAQLAGVPIKKLSAQTILNIINAPQAQKRTAKFKKAVYVIHDQIYKGPYECNDCRLLRKVNRKYKKMASIEITYLYFHYILHSIILIIKTLKTSDKKQTKE